MRDYNGVILASGVFTNASGADVSADFSLPTGTPETGLSVALFYSAAATSSGAGTMVVTIEKKVSGTYYTAATFTIIPALSTTPASKELTQTFVALDATAIRSKITLTGTGATVTARVDLVSAPTT
jgi:hypothetical protein